MKYEIDHIRELLIEKIAGTISDEDNSVLEQALEEDRSVQLLWEALSDQFESLDGHNFLTDLDTQGAWLKVAENLTQKVSIQSPIRANPLTTGLFRVRKIATAAVVLIAASISTFFLLKHEKQPSPFILDNARHPISQAPGDRNQVVLTLANGKSIVLDSAENGVLMKTGDIEVSKTADGQLVYQVTPTGSGLGHDGLNTITTPVGGQYQVILPDDSKVWLNTASTLKFPTAFRGQTREVELTGEAYFEVTRNSAKPFIVKFKLGEVEVLGTGFNVMAYEDEYLMKTTLLEGSVKIKGSETTVLKPGEQAILGTQRMRVERVDVREATAWKNKLFQFNDTPIEAIMREAARWYDLDVRYARNVPERSFTGKISRKVGVDEFLEMLSYAGVKFKIEGRQITVL